MNAGEPIRRLRIGQLQIEVHADRGSLGNAAARSAAEMIRSSASDDGVGIVFAAAPSQDETLAALVSQRDMDWSRVVAFHMDEYLGLDSNHPASFRRYLRERIVDRVSVPSERVRWIPGERTESALEVCLEYARSLEAPRPRLVFAGIGENGHLAFNDPPVADFRDPLPIKVVRLDLDCRRQQVADGGFPSIDLVPTHAYTLTIPTLMAAERMVISVPGPRKAAAVLRSLFGPIDESCPASILRAHPNATLYLDCESAALIGDRGD
jgi:glucosamine-6-phosphate deaminase